MFRGYWSVFIFLDIARAFLSWSFPLSVPVYKLFLVCNKIRSLCQMQIYYICKHVVRSLPFFFFFNIATLPWCRGRVLYILAQILCPIRDWSQSVCWLVTLSGTTQSHTQALFSTTTYITENVRKEFTVHTSLDIFVLWFWHLGYLPSYIYRPENGDTIVMPTLILLICILR